MIYTTTVITVICIIHSSTIVAIISSTVIVIITSCSISSSLSFLTFDIVFASKWFIVVFSFTLAWYHVTGSKKKYRRKCVSHIDMMWMYLFAICCHLLAYALSSSMALSMCICLLHHVSLLILFHIGWDLPFWCFIFIVQSKSRVCSVNELLLCGGDLKQWSCKGLC